MDMPWRLDFQAWMLFLICLCFGYAHSSAPTIKVFTIGTEDFMPRAVRSHGSTPTMLCQVDSDKNPTFITVTRRRTGQPLAKVIGQDLIFTFDPLRGVDTDVYVCTASNLDGSKESTMELVVLSPPQFTSSTSQESLESPFYKGVVGKNLIFSLDFVGWPQPIRTSLTRANTGDVITSRDIKADDDYDAGDDSHFKLTFVPAKKPHWSVAVEIEDLVAEDIGQMYTLIVDNGQEPALHYTFVITDDTAHSSSPAGSGTNTLTIALGVALGVLFIIFVITILCLYTSRYRGGGGIKGMVNDMRGRSRQRSILRAEAELAQGRSSDLDMIENSAYSSTRSIQRRQPPQQQAAARNISMQSYVNSEYNPSISDEQTYEQARLEFPDLTDATPGQPAHQEPAAGNDATATPPVDEGGADDNVYVTVTNNSPAPPVRSRYLAPLALPNPNTKIIAKPPRKSASPSQAPSDFSEIYDFPSPDVVMQEAERRLSGKEWAVPGQHRKLSLPRTDDPDCLYSNF